MCIEFSVQKVDKLSTNSHKLKFSMKSLTFLRLIYCLNLYFAKKLLKKVKVAQGC